MINKKKKIRQLVKINNNLKINNHRNIKINHIND